MLPKRSSLAWWSTCSEMLNKECAHSPSHFHLTCWDKALAQMDTSIVSIHKSKNVPSGVKLMPVIILAPTMVTLLGHSEPQDITVPAKSHCQFTQPGSSPWGLVELCPHFVPLHGDSSRGIWWHWEGTLPMVTWVCIHVILFLHVLQIPCPECDGCVCVPCTAKAEEGMFPHLFKTMQRFAWKHCK